MLGLPCQVSVSSRVESKKVSDDERTRGLAWMEIGLGSPVAAAILQNSFTPHDVSFDSPICRILPARTNSPSTSSCSSMGVPGCAARFLMSKGCAPKREPT